MIASRAAAVTAVIAGRDKPDHAGKRENGDLAFGMAGQVTSQSHIFICLC